MSYVAGLTDTDGYIGLVRMFDKVIGSFRYQERVTIAQIDPSALIEIKKAFGGSFRKRKPQSVRCAPCWDWSLGSEEAVRFCKSILPYLRVKHKQAEMLIEYRTTIRARGHEVTDPFSLVDRTGLYDAIKYLNNPKIFVPRNPYPEYIPDLDFCYLAGAVDGDGSISIGMKTPSKESSRATTMYYEMVYLSGCHDEIPNLLYHYFGGSLIKSAPNPSTGTIMWKWRVERQKAIKCLRELTPHLIIKRTQADLVLKFRDVNLPTLNNCVNPDVVKHRKELYEKVKKLHWNGVVV